jgi:hypothetical protein
MAFDSTFYNKTKIMRAGEVANLATWTAGAPLTATTQLGPVDTSKYSEVMVTLNVTTISGTTPSITLSLQTSDDGGTTWFNLPSEGYTGAAAPSAVTTAVKQLFTYTKPCGVLVQVVATVSGTTPSIQGTLSVSGK